MTHLGHVTAKNIGAFMAKTVDTKPRLMTDESKLYHALGKEFASHEEREPLPPRRYARGDVNTNTVEGMFGVFGAWTSSFDQPIVRMPSWREE